MKHQLTLVAKDISAEEIGNLYSQARESLRDSLRYYIKCGERLIVQKNNLGSRKWAPWIKKNEEILGFGLVTADRLSKSSFLSLATRIDEMTDEEMVKEVKKLWGHEKNDKPEDDGEKLADSQLVQQSLSNEHYTPPEYIQAARLVLEGIDLDPASCEEANKIIAAMNIFTEKDDGLAQKWAGKVWMNPPYGDLVGKFVAKFMTEYAAGSVSAGIILVNAHCTDTKWFQPLWNGTLCFTDHRINFYGDDERSGSTHGSVFAYFGPHNETFAEVFAQFGPIVRRFQADNQKHGQVCSGDLGLVSIERDFLKKL